MKNFLIKSFNILPECILKKKIRCCSFNFFNKECGFKSSYKKDYFQFNFENGIIIKSYYDMCIDFKIPIKGYFKKHTPKQGDVVIDCGAYGGAFSLYVAKLIGEKGKVIAFEPDVENYKLLSKNIELNGLQNIISLNKGAWSKNTFLPCDNKHAGDSSFFNNDQKESLVNTEVVTIDSELDKIGIKNIDFIKMDVEGAEIEALKGAEKILRSSNANLAIASYHILNGEKTCSEVEKLLSGFGYKTETSFPAHLTTYAAKT